MTLKTAESACFCPVLLTGIRALTSFGQEGFTLYWLQLWLPHEFGMQTSFESGTDQAP